MSRAKAWLASQDVVVRATGWTLVGMLAMRDESAPDSWFSERVPTEAHTNAPAF
jgi:hypothetical protein